MSVYRNQLARVLTKVQNSLQFCHGVELNFHLNYFQRKSLSLCDLKEKPFCFYSGMACIVHNTQDGDEVGLNDSFAQEDKRRALGMIKVEEGQSLRFYQDLVFFLRRGY